MAAKIVELKHLNKRYNNKTVLNNVSFSVRQGTIHGFIGPNGAGKSTTLNILVRLVLPDGGEEYVDFKSVRNDPHFNERLGWISAEPNLPNSSVESYLEDIGDLRDIPKKEMLRKLFNSPLWRFRRQSCNSLSTG